MGESAAVTEARRRGYQAGKENKTPSTCPEYSAKDAKVRNAFMEGFYKGFMEFKKNGN
jgi:ribosome modulation factor